MRGNFGGDNHGNSGLATVIGIDLKWEIGFLGNPETIGVKSWAAQRRSLKLIQQKSREIRFSQASGERKKKGTTWIVGARGKNLALILWEIC
ncbi:hypothetical protein U1Q18_046792 [Sarracenia purpurea var. burkii]